MKAVILCAGKGTRLLPITNKIPKCLVNIGGQPLLQYQLSALDGIVDDIIIVAGYLYERVSSFLGGKYIILNNTRFAQTNSIYSLLLAREYIKDSQFILINGDIIFDKALLSPLLLDLESTVTLVDDKVNLINGEMNVDINEGRIIEFSKEIPASRAKAKSLQITMFTEKDGVLLMQRVSELVMRGETHLFPANAYDVIIKNSIMVPGFRQTGVWFEIDNHEDLELAEASLSVCKT